MNLQSVKTRFIGSYIFLLVLFIIQLPIVYVLVGGMSEKYSQVDVAGGLRKRAAEITELLNRQVMTGNEGLKGVFETKRGEYRAVLDSFKTGTETLPAMDDPEALASLDVVSSKWQAMNIALGEAAGTGENLRALKGKVEDSTFPMVAELNTLIAAEGATNDPSVTKHIDATGFQRMRTVKLTYLMERYFISYSEKDMLRKEINKTITGFDSTLAEIRRVALEVSGEKGAGLLDAVNGVEGLWKVRKADINSVINVNDSFHSQVTSLLENHAPAVVASANGLTKLISSRAKADAMRGIFIMALSIVISAVIAIFFMWSTNSMVLKPLVRVKEAVEGLAKGDLTRRAGIKVKLLGHEFNDEITSLGDSVDEMAGQMSEVVGRITDSANLLASASEQLSASSTQIEEGANKQSGQTGQAATAMEEMSATVIEVAKNAQQVSESSNNAQEIAVNGGEVVKQAITAMQEVSESTSNTAETIGKLGKSSEEIGAIVSVIDDIADQTNLLALNAAIEAARAGEQGRGFAVVADEVRKLAERTTSATKEISGMIGSIQSETSSAVESMGQGTDKVDNGVKLVHEAGEALGKIVSGVQSVTDMVSHIATSTEQQSATTDEITRSMDSISDIAKSNVTAIGEVSKATGEMARLATELKELVSRFKIDERTSVSEQDSGSGLKVVSGQFNPSKQLPVAGEAISAEG
jgi:methyl-accepting chemotaxis protein